VRTNCACKTLTYVKVLHAFRHPLGVGSINFSVQALEQPHCSAVVSLGRFSSAVSDV
jgi:hypothetical protein